MNWNKQIKDWYKIPEIKNLVSSFYMKKVINTLKVEYDSKIIYPSKINVFKAFRLCLPQNLKVVILGQDPYHDGSATGLCFANNSDKLNLSPSLESIQNNLNNIVYKNDLNLNFDPTLETWAKQGVLLLNTSLTVVSKKPNSHSKIWNLFTKTVIKTIADNFPGTIFLLWGKEAQKYQIINDYDISKTCHVLKAIHPVAAKYANIQWNHKNFIEVNDIIKKQNGEEFCIKW